MTVLRNGHADHLGTGLGLRRFRGDPHDRRAVAVARVSAARRAQARLWCADHITTTGKLREASFSLNAGEILGIAELQGMGQLGLFLACFGIAT
jgi:ABC-type sugar transport system ATPase subunit